MSIGTERAILKEKMQEHLPNEGKLYRHHKGKIYKVLGYGRMKATKETVVIYRQWGDRRNPVWVRPLSEWWKSFEEVRDGNPDH